MQASMTVLPPTWTGYTLIWFAQLEASFAANRITTEAQKYNIMLSNLPPPLSNEIRDLVVDPTEPFSYSFVKEEILKRTSNSKQKEFAKLFNNEQLGDRKPTQLLRRTKELLRNQQIEESYTNLNKVFFGKLPHSAQTLQSAVKEQNSLKQLELSSRESVNALPSISSELQMMKETYKKLFKL
ncbi:Hypothetical predicted protein [Octopus vulgaris]|uniref:DUF7041 domain-containing protein n=1 Tax=Octopus vulgaris TaxID=6645 RepID=A0AA36F0Q3_OCTVU|nr:Hypothetical predicted protein [Octopus vulgaris]